MAMKYADIIKIRGGKPAYSLEEEKGTEWESFIANDQFNDVLKTVLSAVRGNDINRHKSIWISGTYGSGKSHAAAVISHLLCDPAADIRYWVEREYGEERYRALRESIFSLREKKRLLPVKLESLNNLTHVSELAPLLQTKVVEALNMHDIDCTVDTDYDTLIKHVRDNAVIWDDLIRRNTGLSTIVADREMLVKKLLGKDQGTLAHARAALREANLVVMLEKDTLGAWLIEVQELLREQGEFQGLLILWDEFTDVMSDAVGIPVLKELQTVAQKFMNEENDSFLFLISHPTAFNKIGADATKQTDGRYHRMTYNMVPVSAFKIMSSKFEIIDKEAHTSRSVFFYTVNGGLLDRFAGSTIDRQETRDDLVKLFPIHPGTANLATHYATTVGSSSRSVFEFIGQNDAITDFLQSEEAYAGRDVITADYLWDFVQSVFLDDVLQYGAVTERFSTYRARVENQGAATMAVFKAILLLNAFNNVAQNDNVTPSEDNVRLLFAGSKYEAEVDAALDWINDEGVINRAPGGIFSVQFSALPSGEIEEIKEQLKSSEFRFTSQILKLGDTARVFFEKKYAQQRLIRPYVFDFFSEDTNDSVLRSRITNAKRQARPSSLYLALMFARDHAELAHLREAAETMSKASVDDDKELRDIVFVVIDTPLGEKNYSRFIEYMSSYKAAGNHGFMDQANVHFGHATDMIREWMQDAQRGNATIWVNGEEMPLSIKHLSTTINVNVSPLIFPKGPDAHEMLRTRTPITFWKPQVSKEIIRKFILASSKEDMLSVNGVMKSIQFLVQDALDDNLEWKPDMPAGHQMKAVFDFVNSTIKNFISHGNTSHLFDLTERFNDLTRPPFGLSGNYASAAMVAFAMRPWVNKIYDSMGKPRTADNLADDVALLFNYWEKGKSTSKLSFKFQTPEEGRLCKELVRLFKLDKLSGYSDISSMKDARFALTGVYVKEKGYPLWSLKYLTDDYVNSKPIVLAMNDEVRQLIDCVFAICEEKDQKNVQLVKTTLELIGKYRTDFLNVLKKPDAFRNGFVNFLMSDTDVKLQSEEADSAMGFITQNLQSTIGYWTEEEVRGQLKRWRIQENDRIQQERRAREEAERRMREEEERRKREEEQRKYEAKLQEAKEIVGNPDSAAAKKTAAEKMIADIHDPARLREIIGRVIDLGYEKILDIIINTGD